MYKRQAGVRTTADTWHGMELSWGNIFRFVGDTLSQRGLLWPVVLVVDVYKRQSDARGVTFQLGLFLR